MRRRGFVEVMTAAILFGAVGLVHADGISIVNSKNTGAIVTFHATETESTLPQLKCIPRQLGRESLRLQTAESTAGGTVTASGLRHSNFIRSECSNWLGAGINSITPVTFRLGRHEILRTVKPTPTPEEDTLSMVSIGLAVLLLISAIGRSEIPHRS